MKVKRVNQMTYRTGDSPKVGDFAPAIAVVFTTTGHYYLGPDTDANVIRAAKADVADPNLGYEITQIYVLPCDDEHPCGDADRDPLWSWVKPEGAPLPMRG